ncbi:hypothetical protein GCM10022402_14540 [Salinactinospora qingdaonensis]|uniref:Uncharacterized protein n=2 Tax=Salinactinospora qingdaonensis TaxID=702744 RepID=A0ABP7FB57_9ACTN
MAVNADLSRPSFLVDLRRVGQFQAVIVPFPIETGAFIARHCVERSLPNRNVEVLFDGRSTWRVWTCLVAMSEPAAVVPGPPWPIHERDDFAWPSTTPVAADRVASMSINQLPTPHDNDYSLMLTGLLPATAPPMIVSAAAGDTSSAELWKGP